MSAKEQLNKFIQDAKFKKFQKESASDITRSVADQIVQGVAPAVERAVSQVGNAVANAMEGVRFTPDIHVTTPSVNVPDINVPTPIVNYTPPKIVIPDIKMPDEMNIKGWVNFLGYDKSFLSNPLPVQIRNADGSPATFGGSNAVVGGGGGKADYLTIKGFTQSAFAELLNPDGRLKVETNDGASTTTTEVKQVSGAIDSVNVVSPIAQGDEATAIRVVVAGNSDTSVVVNSGTLTGITNSLEVKQVSGAGFTVEATNLDIRDLVNASDSISSYQVSGHIWSVYAQDAFTTVSATTLVNADNRLKVSVETGGSGLTDAELRASSVPVEQVSGSLWSVSASLETTSVLYNADNRLRVSVETGGSGLTDAELRATAVPVSQVSGSSWSVSVLDIAATNLDIRDLVNATDSVSAYQVSGAIWSTEVKGTVTVDGSGVTQPVSATDLDIRDLVNATDSVRAYQLSGASWSVEATQSGTWNITTLTGITNSVAASIVDSSGVQYSGSNPVPVDLATSLDHTIDSISVRQVSGSIHSSQVKLIARQTNPTAASDAAEVFASADDLGRTLTRPVQVRDLISTAYISLTNGTETTLLAGAASTFHDLIYVMCANQSDAATFVDFRCGTAGSVIMTIQVPASGTAGISLVVPHKMPEVAQAWTADLPDITGTTVDITAQFSKEI